MLPMLQEYHMETTKRWGDRQLDFQRPLILVSFDLFSLPKTPDLLGLERICKTL